MTHRDVYIVSTARTAIGTFGGSLKDTPNTVLATTAVKAAIERSGLPPDAVGHVVMGNVIPTDTKDAYLARVAAIDAGCPIETPAFNVNRLCGSGLQAIISAAQAIGYGDCDVAVGGGSEAMSRGPYFDTAARYGARMGDATSIDYMLGILHDPWQKNAHGHHRRKRGRALPHQPRHARPACRRKPAPRRRRHRGRLLQCADCPRDAANPQRHGAV